MKRVSSWTSSADVGVRSHAQHAWWAPVETTTEVNVRMTSQSISDVRNGSLMGEKSRQRRWRCEVSESEPTMRIPGGCRCIRK